MEKRNNNILEPLVDSLLDTTALVFKLIPKIYDTWGNMVYWLIEGKRYEEVEEIERIETENIKMYEFLPTESFELKKIENIVKYVFIEGEKEGVSAIVGYDLEGELKTFDILEGHAMVGGASRWGKSSFLNVFITNIMLTYTPNEIILGGCDFKKSDIYYFRNYKHFTGGVSTNKQEFMKQMKTLEKEMNNRAEILDKVNCRNAIKYNKKHEKKMPYIIFIIDELVQLTIDNDCSEKLHAIMSKCASYGIYFILASQDFTKNIIGRCKMNCSQVVGFHTLDQTDSETLIGKDINLQDINIKGRCKIKNSEGIAETQIFFLEEEEIERLLKPFEKDNDINTL